MNISYNKPFKLLIDRKMKKKDLREKAGIGSSTMTKLANDENGPRAATAILIKSYVLVGILRRRILILFANP